ncbi:DUF4328 domain-containing protein [Nocardia wallacei]|uniref:DUF4328 domain-containing protein n=2 Tax=Nocardia wallacei TaxID=480035 RepID=UPI0024589CDE|nr:DUF4328 domain-containing protein [Nocardia wallacei]
MNANQYQTPGPVAGTPALPARDARGLRPIGGLGAAAVLLIGTACAMLSVAVVLRWVGYAAVKSRVDGAIGRDAYAAERNTLGPLEVGLWPAAFVVMLVAWIVLTVWLVRARANIDTGNPAPQTFSAKWAVWSWLVPPVLLVFPALFVNDVERASVPRRRGASAAVAIWWSAWLLAWASFWTSTIALRPHRGRTIRTMDSADLDALFQYSAGRSVSVILFCAAAVALSVTVIRVGRAQNAWAA